MSDSGFNNFLLTSVTIMGAVLTAFWAAFIIWTFNDMKARSRDPLAPIAAAIMVAFLYVFGLIIYVMLRPRETLADAYERSLEEEALLQEIEEKPACPGCGRGVKHEWQVCPYCHTKLKKACLHCAQVLELSWNICPYCANPQVDYNAQSLQSGQPQKRQATSGRSTGSAKTSASHPTSQLPASPYNPYTEEPSGVEWVDDNNSAY
jgi:RNA polymerase subunit RPABC4/transcription elongation factor Spt4